MRLAVVLVSLAAIAGGCPWPPSWLGGGSPAPSTTTTTTTTLPSGPPSGTRLLIGPSTDTKCGSVAAGTLANSQLAPLDCGFLYMGAGNGTFPPRALLANTTKQWKAACTTGICALTATTAADVGAARCTDTGCQLDARVPVYNGTLSACVLDKLTAPVTGTLDAVVGDVVFTMSLASTITITGNSASPCPVCTAGTCAASAANAGATCTADASGSSFECVPTGTTLAPLAFDIPFSNVGQFDRPLPLGYFCSGQTSAGAFGYPTADNIRTTGLATRSLDTPTPYKARITAVFCVAATGSLLVDGAIGLPGPAAVTVPVTFELDP
jgi:hypothetical protein